MPLWTVYWGGGTLATPNRREAVRAALSWLKSGMDVTATFTRGSVVVGLPIGNSAVWTERKWKEVCDALSS